MAARSIFFADRREGAARTDPPLRTDCRHGQIEMYLESNDAPNAEIFESEGHVTVRIDYEAFRKLLKDLPTAIRAFKGL